ncbi:sialic acid-binding Ig-like lectin 8 [Xenopus laevis]|uniref:Sialic acid-binding Ig-like lectin 8 n=1 Tax=Xenopus laevis TaxID=8355 RepID=A0A8J0TDC3_XENLA|nr:sialic acid-binding Ig-like lectin 8 [Xenopus laevis]
MQHIQPQIFGFVVQLFLLSVAGNVSLKIHIHASNEMSGERRAPCDQHVSLNVKSVPSVSPNSVIDLLGPTISPLGKLIAGKQITLSCTSHPAPQGCKGMITWEGMRNIKNTNNYERKDQAGKITSISVIRFTPSQGDDNSSLTCTVTYSGVSTNSSITLDVEYPPSMTITVAGYNGTYENKSVTIKEGDSRLVRCEVNSNPVAKVSWSRKKDIFIRTSGKSLTLALNNVSVADAVTYKCFAQNTHGSITATVTINVESLTNNTIHLKGITFGGIFVLLTIILLTIIVITVVLVMRCKKKRRSPEQVEENKRSSPNNYEVVHCNIERISNQEPNMAVSSPSECERSNEDLQYVTLDFLRSKPESSPEPQESLYSEVK